MKKFILSAMVAATAGFAVAQSPVQFTPEQTNYKVKDVVYTKEGRGLRASGVSRRGAGDLTDKYQFTTAYEESMLFGQKLTTFVSWLYPDTTGYTVSNTGTKSKVGFHVLGSTFDPKDSNFQAVGKTVFTKFQSYKLDTLSFVQFYIRNLDSFDAGGGNFKQVVDTAYIQYFDAPAMDITRYYYQGNPQAHWYGVPKVANYSTKTLLNSAAVKTDTIFLDANWADSIAIGAGTVFGRGIKIPVGLNSKSTSTTPIYNNVLAYTITFKPMKKASLGDTLIAWNGANVSKKLNAYGIRLAYQQNHDQQIPNEYRVNNSIITNFEVRYGATVSSIFKSYLPGTLFGSTLFVPAEWSITTANLNSKEVGMGDVTVFPNPASTNASATVVFNLAKASNVKATVTDLNGRAIRNLDSRHFVAGQNSLQINTQGMSKGMYLVVLESNGTTASAKLNIN
ncbi:MAG: T9SS type A sorting domain-containing protein [Bacteroidetes bacterium]|nr:T9SS type A sorting domain-containing protein [Bacteroidota bacterium]